MTALGWRQVTWRQFFEWTAFIVLAALVGLAVAGAVGVWPERIVGAATSLAATVFFIAGVTRFVRQFRRGWREGGGKKTAGGDSASVRKRDMAGRRLSAAFITLVVLVVALGVAAVRALTAAEYLTAALVALAMAVVVGVFVLLESREEQAR
jgi:hypothetical protein